MNELIAQVADDDAQYRHNQMQLQHSVWLLSRSPGSDNDDAVPDVLTQVTAVEHMQLPSLTSCALTNTVMAQPRCKLAAESMSMQVVVIMTNNNGSLCYVDDYEPDTQLCDAILWMKL